MRGDVEGQRSEHNNDTLVSSFQRENQALSHSTRMATVLVERMISGSGSSLKAQRVTMMTATRKTTLSATA